MFPFLQAELNDILLINVSWRKQQTANFKSYSLTSKSQRLSLKKKEEMNKEKKNGKNKNRIKIKKGT
jgi:hypothetical protein